MYVPLDVNFPDDEKIIAVGLDGAGLYAQALCLAKRMGRDGRLTWAHLRRLGSDDELIESLIAVGLLHENDDALWITAWLDHNLSQEEIDEKRSTDAQRKRTSRKNRPSGRDKTSKRTPESVRPDAEGASEDVRALEVETEVEAAAAEKVPSDKSRDQCIDAAIDLLLRRDGSVELSQSKQNPSGWLNAARNGRKSDHFQDASKAWTKGMTPDELADILEPPPKPIAAPQEYVAGQEPSDFETQAQMVKRIKAEREAAA